MVVNVRPAGVPARVFPRPVGPARPRSR